MSSILFYNLVDPSVNVLNVYIFIIQTYVFFLWSPVLALFYVKILYVLRIRADEVRLLSELRGINGIVGLPGRIKIHTQLSLIQTKNNILSVKLTIQSRNYIYGTSRV